MNNIPLSFGIVPYWHSCTQVSESIHLILTFPFLPLQIKFLRKEMVYKVYTLVKVNLQLPLSDFKGQIKADRIKV